MRHSVVAGWGSYLPARIVTNAELDPALQTNDAWIRERTGITQRHIAAADETTSSMAIAAGAQAIARAGLKPEQIDLVIVATATPDFTFPGTAPLVQAALGCGKAGAMDVNGACSGYVYALLTADGLLKSGVAHHALVIGAETMTRVVDWSDRGTCILFGDGAGALVLSAREETGKAPRGILGGEMHADGSLAGILKTNGGTSTTQTAGFLAMQGKEVFRHAVARMSESALSVLAKAKIAADQVDWVVPHQANARILTACAERLNVPAAKMVMTVDRHANTSSASIPLALAAAADDGRLEQQNIVLLTALGAGLTWGSCIIRW